MTTDNTAVNDVERLERYVGRFFLRKRREAWPTLRDAARGLRWRMTRLEDAIRDSELLDTQSYYCAPPEPRHEHEIYSYDEGLS